MLVPETLKTKPSDNYDDLKRQFFALRNLCESKIKECSIYSNRLAEYDRQSLIARNEAIESEREMNAQLTYELEAANERIRELEKHVSDFNEQTSKIAEKLGEERGKNASLQGELSRTKSNMKSLAKELQESDDDLEETQKQLSEKNSLIEEIKEVFSDSVACSLFEPFNAENLAARLAHNNQKQQYLGAKKLLDSIAGKYPPSEISSKVCLVLANNLQAMDPMSE